MIAVTAPAADARCPDGRAPRRSPHRIARLTLGLLAAAYLVAAPAGRAEEAKEPAKPTAPSLSDVLAASGIAVNGYLDVSYSHLDGEGYFVSGVPDRVFDDRKDSLSLHQAALTVGYQPKEGFGALVNVIAGQDPDVFAPYDINPGAHSKLDVPQAYVQYAGGPWTVIAGRYVTLAGAETIDPRTDTNFSRSILFGFAIPFTHTGVRATYAPTDQLSLVLGVNNGWDALRDTNTAKTLELGATFTPLKAFSLTADGYFGKERVGGLVGFGPEGMRDLVDLVATWNVNDALTLVLNVDWGRQEGAAGTGLTANNADTARWDGLAGYLNYQISDQFRLSVRAEYLDDKDGYRTGVVQKWKEATVTFGYAPAKAFELRFEGRYDKSDSSVFVRSPTTDFTGAFTDLADNQASIAVEALYKF